jgi:hypothetical protein
MSTENIEITVQSSDLNRLVAQLNETQAELQRVKDEADQAARGLNNLGDEANRADSSLGSMGETGGASASTIALGAGLAGGAMMVLEKAMEAAAAAAAFLNQSAIAYLNSTSQGQAILNNYNQALALQTARMGEVVGGSAIYQDLIVSITDNLDKLTTVTEEVVGLFEDLYSIYTDLSSIYRDIDEATGGLITTVRELAATINPVTQAWDFLGDVYDTTISTVSDLALALDLLNDEVEPKKVTGVNDFATAWVNFSDSMFMATNATDFFLQTWNRVSDSLGFGAETTAQVVTATTASAGAVEEVTEALKVQIAISSEGLKLAQEIQRQKMEEIAATERQIALEQQLNTERQASLTTLSDMEAQNRANAASIQAFRESVEALSQSLQPGNQALETLGGTTKGVASSVSSSLGAALGTTEDFGKAFQAALGQSLIALGIQETLTGISNLIPFGPLFNPVAGAARLVAGPSLIAAGRGLGGGGGSSPSVPAQRSAGSSSSVNVQNSFGFVGGDRRSVSNEVADTVQTAQRRGSR